jgi:multidrug efflux pump subunit AcrB
MVLGMVVDDAIVVGESIQSSHERKIANAAVIGTFAVAPPVLLAVITTIITFIPSFFIPGLIGLWISQISIALIAVLIFSVLECMFLLPCHLRHPPSESKNFFREKLDQAVDYLTNSLYRPLYVKALEAPFLVIIAMIAICIFCAGLIQGGQLRFSFFPQGENRYIQGRIDFSTSTPLSQVEEALRSLQQSAEEVNKKFPNNPPIIQHTSLRTEGHSAIIWAKLCKSEQRPFRSSEVAEHWQKLTPKAVGAITTFFGGLELNPGGRPVEIHLFSTNVDSLSKAAEELQFELTQFQGVYNVTSNSVPGKPVFIPKLTDKGKLLGVSEQDLRDKLVSGFLGQEVFKIQRGPDEVRVKVLYEQSQNSRPDLTKSFIMDLNGEKIPLSEIVTWEIQSGQAQIYRRQKKQTITVYADVNTKIITASEVIEELENVKLQKIREVYPDVDYNIGGAYQENQKSTQSLILVFQYAYIIVFVILAIFFRSYLQPLLIFFVLPLSSIGAILGHWLWGTSVSIMSIFGLFALCGILVNDSLVLLHSINTNISKGLPLKEALIEGGVSRFRAIVLTSVTSFLGLLPLLFETSWFAVPLIQMALSIAFGLVFGTFLTLFLTPALFWYLNTLRVIFHWVLTGKKAIRETVEPAFRSK